MNKTNETIMIFSHGDLDGVGCVILAQLAFGKDGVDYEICNYDTVDGKIREYFLCTESLHDAVYITDISVNDEVAEEIDRLVDNDENWYLLDHHATALRLNSRKWADVRVESVDGVKTCGTEMFYEHLMENGYFNQYTVAQIQNIHRFVEVVRDYDTWRWKTELGDEGIVCKQVNDLFHIYGREAFVEDTIGQLIYPEFYGEYPTFTEIDIFLLNQKQKEIDIYVNQKSKQLTRLVDKFGYSYGVVFIERFASEVGNRLSEMNPDLDYIAMINLAYGKVEYRTTRDHIDLGQEIAHSFGGGGHRKAAGSQFDAKDIMYIVLGNIFNIEYEDAI